MRPPAPPVPGLVIACVITGAVMAAYVAAGWAHDRVVRRRKRAAERIESALSTILFQGEAEAAAAAELLDGGSRRVLLDMIQRLANDLSGDADARLRKLVATIGLAQPIRGLIGSRQWRRRVQGAALATLLPETDPARVGLLHDPHPTVRARAAESLEAADAVAQVDVLLALLDDDVHAVRFAAQQALLRNDSRVVPALEAYLMEADGDGVVWALEVAANLPDPRLIPAIQRHLRSLDPTRRAIATDAIVPWLDDAELLVELFGDEDPEVRATAARAAGTASAELLAAHVGRLLRDAVWEVRHQAGQALATMGPTGTMVLRIHLDDPDPYARDMAALMLDTLAARDGSLLRPRVSTDQAGAAA